MRIGGTVLWETRAQGVSERGAREREQAEGHEPVSPSKDVIRVHSNL